MTRFVLLVMLVFVLLTGCSPPSFEDTTPTLIEAPIQDVTESEEAPPPTSTVTATMPPTPTGTPVPPSPTPEPTETVVVEAVLPAAEIAFIGPDGNLWLVNRESGERVQLSSDAAPFQADSDQAAINYCCPRWSSDGQLLAYRREVSSPIDSGYQTEHALWVTDLSSGESRALLEGQSVLGFDWQPGAHKLTYGHPIEMEYFLDRSTGESSEMATGIWMVDATGGDPYELVPPERGYALVGPNWSPDGRFLGFDEVLYMEGRGQFAYFDFETQSYMAWDDVIGSYSWSGDGEQLAYDRLSYVPTGGERIWLNSRLGGEEQALTPKYEQGYAFQPLFSPQGEQLAYLAEINGLESLQYNLFVMEVPDGESINLGVFDRMQGLSWTPDGKSLVFSAGPYEQQQVMEVNLSNGTASVLVPGSQPAWQPVSP